MARLVAIRNMKFFTENLNPIGWSSNDDGIALFFLDKKKFSEAQNGLARGKVREVFELFELLLEAGDASVVSNRGGIFLPSEDAVRLDGSTRECFGLPPKWPGSLVLETHSVPNLSDFDAKLRLVGIDGRRLDTWSLDGGILSVRNDRYLPDAETYACLMGYRHWKSCEEGSEAEHLRLIHVLTEAARRGCRVDVSSAGKLKIAKAAEVAVNFQEQSDGSLLLTPVPMVEGLAELLGSSDSDAQNPTEVLLGFISKIETRLSQLNSKGEEGVIRIGSTLVLLDAAQTHQARVLVKDRRVPAEQAEAFRKNPARWMADNQFIHGEVEFLPRVIGIGEWVGGYLGASGELGEKVDWFNEKPKVEKEKGNDTGEKEDESPVEPPASPLEHPVPIIASNERELEWGLRQGGDPAEEVVSIAPDFSHYPRPPFSHQVKAVQWLGLNAERCGKPQRWTEEQKHWGAGALLADDMGLGKTLSTLVFLREWLQSWSEKTGKVAPACLIVSPLSLIENWKEEIEKTFGEALSPFSRIVQAIPAAELSKFHATRNGRDEVEPGFAEDDGKVVQYGLKFGSKDAESLDQPGTIVLTTYTTLRDHRFSFAGCDWSAVVFDEAQNVKNPNALQTIASKALKGFFRIALSGTPVENHLGDLWCLMDTVEPGALGSFDEFKQNFITPIRQDPSKTGEICKALREHLGTLMLRRTKEESLKGLPKKTICPVEIPMTAHQAELYDEILYGANLSDGFENEGRKRNQWLASMWELRRVSLHPDLLGDAVGEPVSGASKSRAYLSQAGKLRWLLEKLDEIRNSGEKVLLFAVQKKFQELLRKHLAEIYGLKISVINGDTKAVATQKSNETRLSLIAEFSEAKGFGICILSPIAAGAGLNITAANHVIHLERHWNPSKEDQATDRTYRIGQKRNVNVYFPLLLHPTRKITTFDTGLNRLIDQKRNLAGSLGLMPTPSVTETELFDGILRGNALEQSPKFLTVEDARKLSWELFEALIACLYEGDAKRVILTPKGSDHGADVVVLGHREHGNILVQVKTTSKSTLDSGAAVCELEGAGPFYERTLGLKIPLRCLHSNTERFSKKTKEMGKLYRTQIYGISWLTQSMAKQPLTRAQVIARNAKREAF